MRRWNCRPKAVGDKAVAPDDDCIPVKPVEPKPKVVKRSVFADGPAKAEKKSFSEQVGAARKRLSPPAVAKPLAVSDC